MDLFIFLIVIITFGLMASDPRGSDLKTGNNRLDQTSTMQNTIKQGKEKEDSNESS